MKIFSIWKIVNKNDKVYIELDPKYSKGLKGLEGYVIFKYYGWQINVKMKTDRK